MLIKYNNNEKLILTLPQNQSGERLGLVSHAFPASSWVSKLLLSHCAQHEETC